MLKLQLCTATAVFSRSKLKIQLGFDCFVKPDALLTVLAKFNAPHNFEFEELDGPAVSTDRRAIAEVKQLWSLDG
jgi:hypothetical protein